MPRFRWQRARRFASDPEDDQRGQTRFSLGSGRDAGLGNCRLRHTGTAGPTSETIAPQKAAAVESLLQGARAAADQFEAGVALGARTDTVCTRGTQGLMSHDWYRSECSVRLTTAYAVDISPMPALSGLDERLKPEGWYLRGAGWTLTRGRGDVVDLKAWNRNGYHLKDLVGVGYTGPQGASLGIRPVASSTPVPAVEPTIVVRSGPGAYFASKEGADWQIAWTKQRSRHPYLLLVGGLATFAQQPW